MFVKVCGTTSEEDALLAVAMGADAVHQHQPRKHGLEQRCIAEDRHDQVLGGVLRRSRLRVGADDLAVLLVVRQNRIGQGSKLISVSHRFVHVDRDHGLRRVSQLVPPCSASRAPFGTTT